MDLTYQNLKAQFDFDQESFRVKYTETEEARKRVISVLAHAGNDNGWPLAMLAVLEPRLSRGLAAWTAGGYEDIRKAQESGSAVDGSSADCLNQTISLLPYWSGSATHVSKDARWFDRVSNGLLELKSMMGCCAPGFTFAYVSCPRAILSFTQLKSARLIGALTTENCEREVVLLPGTRLRVVSVERSMNKIHLIEEAA